MPRSPTTANTTMPYLDPASDRLVRVRDLGDDEKFVLSEFESHARHCSRCVDPLEVHREGRTLCEQGLHYAADVASYIFCSGGKVYSAIDRELDHALVNLRIPREYKWARRLLLATEEGLRLPSTPSPATAKPVVRYIEVSPDRLADSRRRSMTEPVTEIIERVPHNRRRVIIYPRGSLYKSDTAERPERRHVRVHR